MSSPRASPYLFLRCRELSKQRLSWLRSKLFARICQTKFTSRFHKECQWQRDLHYAKAPPYVTSHEIGVTQYHCSAQRWKRKDRDITHGKSEARAEHLTSRNNLMHCCPLSTKGQCSQCRHGFVVNTTSIANTDSSRLCLQTLRARIERGNVMDL